MKEKVSVTSVLPNKCPSFDKVKCEKWIRAAYSTWNTHMFTNGKSMMESLFLSYISNWGRESFQTPGEKNRSLLWRANPRSMLCTASVLHAGNCSCLTIVLLSQIILSERSLRNTHQGFGWTGFGPCSCTLNDSVCGLVCEEKCFCTRTRSFMFAFDINSRTCNSIARPQYEVVDAARFTLRPSHRSAIFLVSWKRPQNVCDVRADRHCFLI